jgi:hypothetical protein
LVQTELEKTIDAVEAFKTRDIHHVFPEAGSCSRGCTVKKYLDLLDKELSRLDLLKCDAEGVNRQIKDVLAWKVNCSFPPFPFRRWNGRKSSLI